MNLDYYLLASLAVLAFVDSWIERLSGQGIIGHVMDWMERRIYGR